MKTSNLHCFLALTCMLWGGAVFAVNAEMSSVREHVYSFGVVPQQSAKKMAKLWTPILLYINQKTGYTLQFTTAKNIPVFESRLTSQRYDFSYMNPYHYTVFSKSSGYQAFAKRQGQPIKGIVVVQKESAIRSLQDLANQTIAFPAPAAFAATILPRAELDKQSIAHGTRFVSSHDSVYLNVAKGLFPAGGGVKRTLNNTQASVRDNLRVLWETNAYTPHAFAAHRRIDADVVKTIQNAFLGMSQDPQGLALLKKIKVKKGIEAANDSDWDDVRDLNIHTIDKAKVSAGP